MLAAGDKQQWRNLVHTTVSNTQVTVWNSMTSLTLTNY